jgi:hypothetical protein
LESTIWDDTSKKITAAVLSSQRIEKLVFLKKKKKIPFPNQQITLHTAVFFFLFPPCDLLKKKWAPSGVLLSSNPLKNNPTRKTIYDISKRKENLNIPHV